MAPDEQRVVSYYLTRAANSNNRNLKNLTIAVGSSVLPYRKGVGVSTPKTVSVIKTIIASRKDG